MCIINQQTEFIFILECCDFFQLSLITCHSKYPFCNYQYTTSFLFFN